MHNYREYYMELLEGEGFFDLNLDRKGDFIKELKQGVNDGLEKWIDGMINYVEENDLNSRLKSISRGAYYSLARYIMEEESSIEVLEADFTSYRGCELEELDDKSLRYSVEELLKQLEESPLPPDRIHIVNPHILKAIWIPPFPVILDDVKEYLNILSNFQDYLDTLDFTNGKSMLYSISDDGDLMVDLQNRSLLYLDLFGIKNKGRLTNVSRLIKEKEPIDDKYINVLDYHSNYHSR